MSEVKKIATRESYGNALVEIGKEHEDLVVLDADLAGATKTAIFQKVFPERHIDCGIAEGNMMGVAAGLATTGKVPFASSFAMFAAGRAFEQIRNSIGYPHLNVKIGATHAGISVGEDGATHQCNEDIALMRMIPGMVIINPADDVEARAAVKAAYEYVGPVYMRFGRLQSRYSMMRVPINLSSAKVLSFVKAAMLRSLQPVWKFMKACRPQKCSQQTASTPKSSTSTRSNRSTKSW